MKKKEDQNNYILLEDVKTEIENSFIYNGWVTIYKSTEKPNDPEAGIIYCSICHKRNVSKIFKECGLDLQLGHGRPGFVFSYSNIKINC